jgi:branched-chain amino acid transport system permease protein
MATVTSESVAAVKRGNPLAPVLALRAKPWFRPFAVAFVLFVGLVVIPATMKANWIANFTQMAVFAPLAASAGLLYGRVGLVSLGQVAPYGVGAWVAIRLSFATSLPFPLLVVAGGVAAMILGVVIGLPALRVSGLYLALVTLMLVAAVELLLAEFKFANGGKGFRGIAKNLSEAKPMRRPSFAQTDLAYFRFAVVASFLLFMLAAFMLARKPGRAWASIRQSEAAALSAGIDITRYKMLAFALASFMAGCAGALYAGSVPSSISVGAFSRQQAIFLVAVVLMGGYHSLWGAVLAGFFGTCFLAFLKQNVLGHQLWDKVGFSLFGFGLIMNLVQSTKDMEKKGLL